jgi:hypothetical protein
MAKTTLVLKIAGHPRRLASGTTAEAGQVSCSVSAVAFSWDSVQFLTQLYGVKIDIA